MTGGPLQRVMDAIENGARGRTRIVQATGLSPDLVDMALEQLERLGMLSREEIGSGCPSGGCGSCPAVDGCVGTPGRGPVMLTLRRRPPTARS